ncbi:MAG: hypothetical protein AAFN77_16410 [Planctomycetota bacterium]
MSGKNRAGLIDKLFKVAKKEYTFDAPPSNRNVLEHLIYGCCLENSTFEAADEALAKLQENFCDWNEVRVTTVDELAEATTRLTQPAESALSVKRTLFGVFEKYFTYDLDFLKKENLSKAVETFETFKGVSSFVISYVAQNGLGGHSIPVDRSMMSLFYVLGIVSEAEAETGRVPGLERAVAKAKGAEFFGLVHQLAVAFATSPFSRNVREVLLKVNADAKERFPKRGVRKKEPEPAKVTAKSTKTAAKETKTTQKKTTAKKSTAKKATAKKATAKKPTTKKAAAKKKPNKATKSTKSTKKATARKAAKSTKAAKKKSPTKRLSKKKPR